MKYNKIQNLEFLKYNLLVIFSELGIEESLFDSISPQELRELINQTYPALIEDQSSSQYVIDKKRRKLLLLATQYFYYYQLANSRG